MLLERCVQRTQSYKYKEKVQKLNRENAEKATVIFVENISSEIKYEGESETQSFISIDIPLSHTETHVQDGMPISSSVKETEPISAIEEVVNGLTEVEEEGELVQEDEDEEQLVILMTDDELDICENKYEDNEDNEEAIREEENEDDNSSHMLAVCDQIEKHALETTDSESSENLVQILRSTNTNKPLSPCPAFDTEEKSIPIARR